MDGNIEYIRGLCEARGLTGIGNVVPETFFFTDTGFASVPLQPGVKYFGNVLATVIYDETSESRHHYIEGYFGIDRMFFIREKFVLLGTSNVDGSGLITTSKTYENLFFDTLIIDTGLNVGSYYFVGFKVLPQ